jgi:hypothetical protein
MMATTIAATMTVSSRARPIAVAQLRAVRIACRALKPLMHLQHAFHQQKRASTQEYEVATGHRLRRHVEQRCHQVRNPHQGKQKANACEHRERQPADARLVLQLRWQALHQDGDKDEIVDAEHDLEQRQREKG